MQPIQTTDWRQFGGCKIVCALVNLLRPPPVLYPNDKRLGRTSIADLMKSTTQYKAEIQIKIKTSITVNVCHIFKVTLNQYKVHSTKLVIYRKSILWLEYLNLTV